MPLYEFRCNDCGEKFTALVGYFEREKIKCPKCGSKNITQLISACSFTTGSGGGCGGSKRPIFGG